jgi:glucosamine-6-phosphate deaminase
MRIHICPTPRVAARSLARDVARTLRRQPDLVIGLPAGRTPIPLYEALVALHRAGRLDFSAATAFNLDEFVGLAKTHPASYGAFLRHHLFAAIDLRPARIHLLDGASQDAARECARYERAIARAGGLDVAVLGIGANGHIGFNEPGPALTAETHRVRLAAATRRANAALFGGRLSQVPREALSMGIGTILRARRIALLATGRSKAGAVARMLEGPVTPRVPASFLQLHPRVEVWLDRAAAARLRRATRRAAAPSGGPRRPRRWPHGRNRARGGGG